MLKPIQWIRLLMVASVGLATTFFAYDVWETRYNANKDAKEQIVGATTSLREQVHKVMEVDELTIQLVDRLISGMSWQQIADSPEITQELQNLDHKLPQVAAILLVAPDGKVVTMSPANRKTVAVSDREYFQVLQQTSVSQMFISETMEGRVTHRLVFNVSRRRRSSDGKFDGVIVVSNTVKYLEEYYADIADDDVSVFLARDTGEILAAHPHHLREELSLSESVLAAAKTDTPIVVKTSLMGNPSRIAIARVSSYPLLVGAAIPEMSVTTAWLGQLIVSGILVVVGGIILGAMGWTVVRVVHRETATHNLLQEEMRRRHIAEQRMQQSQRMEALGELTAGVAHDFNNLLAIVMGQIELAQIHADDAQKRRFDIILTAARRGAGLVRSMLVFSRRQMLQPEPRDVNEELRQFSELLITALRKEARLEFQLSTEKAICAIDHSELELAILNIANNARMAMRDDNGHLVISTKIVDISDRSGLDLKAGRYLEICFDDDGVGMPPEVLARAFDPFFTTRDVGEGTGMGLSQVYGFTKQSGGAATIESTVDLGTTVKMYLPIMSERIEQPSSDRQPLVIVVDDASDILEFVAETLQEAGHHVIQASNGKEAYDLVVMHAREVEMLITDVVMPGGMSGIELAQRAKDVKPELKVLLMTGFSGQAISGGLPVLHKPFRSDQILKAANDLLHGRGLGRWQ